MRKVLIAAAVAACAACSQPLAAPIAQDSPSASASPAEPSATPTVDPPSKTASQLRAKSEAPKPDPDRGTVWCAQDEPVDDRGNYVCVEWFVLDEVADVDQLDRDQIATITINWSDCVGEEGGQVHPWCPGLTSGSVKTWTADDLRALGRAFERFAQNERADGNDEVADWQARTAEGYRRYADDVEARRRPAPTA